MKRLLIKSILIFIIILILATSLLTLVASIPNKYIEENIKKSVSNYTRENTIFPEIQKGRQYTTIDNYADSVLLNIIYSIDNTQPLSSVLMAKYYEDEVRLGTTSLEKKVENNNEPNTNYLRYWHGSITILKPLLMIFTVEQIHIVLSITIAILLIVLMIEIGKIDKKLVIGFIIGLFMISIWVVPLCFEYVWTFILMAIISIVALKMKDSKKENLYLLFFVSGILTCFLDFFTTEIITLFIPMLFIYCYRYKSKKIVDWKKEIKFILLGSILWTIGYAGMYLAKWIMVSIVLQHNYIEECLSFASTRINGNIERIGLMEMTQQGILRNLKNLYPIYLWKYREIFYAVIILAIISKIIYLKIKKKQMIFPIILIIISIMPYLRYIVLPNHSFLHCFFTYRSQLITIVALIIFFTYNVKKEIWFKEIKITKNRNKENNMMKKSQNN